jgi:protein phosphatase
VGDSRAYVLRNGDLFQLTEDHSLVGEMVRSGILSTEDAQSHPKRNVITRSLGTHQDLAPDFPSTPYTVADGDVFLLCSDGLTSMVPDEDVRRIVDSYEPADACQALVDLANANGGKDNISVQVVKIIPQTS